jgi:hypothetical protein
VRARGFYDGEPLGAAPCAGCHADVAAQWASSAHRFSSFNNPYYRVAVDDFRRERGRAAARFCARCHEPVLLAGAGVDRAAVSGVARSTNRQRMIGVDGEIDVASREAQAGIVCLVCHSIDAVPDLEGNGGYRLRSDNVPLGPPAHSARLRPPLLAEARLCSTCHKVGLGPEVTHDRWLRGQDDYDAWQASAASGNGAAAVFRPAHPSRCQDCHMPLEPAVRGDAAAKDGQVRSHRFLGANAALPSLRGDADALARVRRFLDGAATLDLVWSGPARVDVVLRARGVGHRLPGGTMDSNQLWLEVDALDADERRARSGRRADSDLASDAHLVRAQPVDGEGRPLARRDPQHLRGTAYDTSLSPSDPQVVRYLVPPGTTRVEARLLYRKFAPDYARRACGNLPQAVRDRCVDVPIVELARAELTAGAPAPREWERALAYGLGLADARADEASDALPWLAASAALAPERAEPLLGLARLFLRLGRTDEAVGAAARAEALAPAHPAAPFLRATALARAYRHAEARPPAERLAALLPLDRAALLLAARVRGVTGDASGALEAADRAVAVDPDLDEAHYQRALALAELGRAVEAAAAETAYLAHRVATEIDLALRARLRARDPAAPDESVPVHTHVVR